MAASIWVTKSLGFKRLLTSLLLMLVGLSETRLVLVPYIPTIHGGIALLGSVALIHAGYKGTLGVFKSGSFAAAFSVILAISDSIVPYWPYIPLLHVIGIALGGIGVGEAIGKADVIANPAPTMAVAIKAQQGAVPKSPEGIQAQLMDQQQKVEQVVIAHDDALLKK